MRTDLPSRKPTTTHSTTHYHSLRTDLPSWTSTTTHSWAQTCPHEDPVAVQCVLSLQEVASIRPQGSLGQRHSGVTCPPHQQNIVCHVVQIKYGMLSLFLSQFKPRRVKSSQFRSSEAKPNRDKSIQMRLNQVKPNRVNSIQVRSSQVKPNRVKSIQVRSSQAMPSQTNPGQVNSGQVESG